MREARAVLQDMESDLLAEWKLVALHKLQGREHKDLVSAAILHPDRGAVTENREVRSLVIIGMVVRSICALERFHEQLRSKRYGIETEMQCRASGYSAVRCVPMRGFTVSRRIIEDIVKLKYVASPKPSYLLRSFTFLVYLVNMSIVTCATDSVAPSH